MGLRIYDIDHSAEALFLFNRKLRSLLNKTLRGMRARAKWKLVAKATALGAGVPLAELLFRVAVRGFQMELFSKNR